MRWRAALTSTYRVFLVNKSNANNFTFFEVKYKCKKFDIKYSRYKYKYLNYDNSNTKHLTLKAS